jgi:hypothetical protein
MDQSRFDAITRTLAAPSRRSLLSIAGAGALTALLGRGDTGAGKGKKKKKKKKKPPVQPSGCTPSCTGGRECINGTCTCTGTLRDCGAAGCLECCPNENFGYCCPSERPTCWDDFGNEHFKRCAANGVCQCREDQPDQCVPQAGFPGICWECCTDTACVLNPFYEVRGMRQCKNNHCGCPDNMTLCTVIGAGNPPKCTDTRIDNNNCGGCGVDNPSRHRCNTELGQTCVDGTCTNPGSP